MRRSEDSVIDEAPNYDGRWPGAAKRLGPAWQVAWDRMVDGLEYTVAELTWESGVTVRSMRNVLAQAHRAGFVDKRQAIVPGKGLRCWYRRNAKQRRPHRRDGSTR